MKCFVIPLSIQANDIATERLKEYLETVAGKHSVDSGPKQKLHIIKKMLQSE
jgi:hypothetical protein